MEGPSPALPLLEALRDDEEEYVRRSVANHSNDISKDNSDFIADIAKKWMGGADKNRKRLLSHACRTLIKQGQKETLPVLGVMRPKLTLEGLSLERKAIQMGEALTINAQLRSTAAKPQSLIIDYVLHFKKKNGALTPKVLKWTKAEIGPNATLSLRRAHVIKPITTRVYYPGEQSISLRINGEDFGCVPFALEI